MASRIDSLLLILQTSPCDSEVLVDLVKVILEISKKLTSDQLMTLVMFFVDKQVVGRDFTHFLDFKGVFAGVTIDHFNVVLASENKELIIPMINRSSLELLDEGFTHPLFEDVEDNETRSALIERTARLMAKWYYTHRHWLSLLGRIFVPPYLTRFDTQPPFESSRFEKLMRLLPEDVLNNIIRLSDVAKRDAVIEEIQATARDRLHDACPIEDILRRVKRFQTYGEEYNIDVVNFDSNVWNALWCVLRDRAIQGVNLELFNLLISMGMRQDNRPHKWTLATYTFTTVNDKNEKVAFDMLRTLKDNGCVSPFDVEDICRRIEDSQKKSEMRRMLTN